MKNDNNPTICYSCIHRGNLQGDCHSKCQHPTVTSNKNESPLNGIMAIFASVGRVAPVISPIALELNIQGNEHGIRSGWFNWPYNFDPIWLTNCNGYEKPKKT